MSVLDTIDHWLIVVLACYGAVLSTLNAAVLLREQRRIKRIREAMRHRAEKPVPKVVQLNKDHLMGYQPQDTGEPKGEPPDVGSSVEGQPFYWKGHAYCKQPDGTLMPARRVVREGDEIAPRCVVVKAEASEMVFVSLENEKKEPSGDEKN